MQPPKCDLQMHFMRRGYHLPYPTFAILVSRFLVGNARLVRQDRRDGAWLVKKRQPPGDLAIGGRVGGGREPGKQK